MTSKLTSRFLIDNGVHTMQKCEWGSQNHSVSLPMTIFKMQNVGSKEFPYLKIGSLGVWQV